MLKLKYLELFNFGIFKGKVVLDFSDKDIVGILAEYVSDKERSNRSGKTLITEAIRYNLTGLKRAKREIGMIHYGEDLMYTLGTYVDEDTDEEYVIKRGRDINDKGILEIDWIEKTTEAQKAINDIFGISKDDFDLTCFFKQSDIHGFMTLDTAKKTEHLMRWLDNTHWQEKEAKVKEDIKVLKDRLRDTSTTIKALTESLEVTENLDIELKLVSDNIELCSNNLKKKELEYEKVNNKFLNYKKSKSDLKDKIIRTEDNISEIDKTLNNQRRDIQEYNDLLKDYRVLCDKLKDSDGYEEKITLANTEVGNYKSSIGLLRSKLNNFKSNKSGHCPVLNESCDRVVFSKDDVFNIETEITTLSQKVHKINSDIENLTKFRAIDRNKSLLTQRLKDKKSNIDKSKEKTEGFSDRKDALLKELETLKKQESEDSEELKSQLSNLRNEIDSIKSELNRFNQRSGAISERIKKSKDAIEKLNELTNREDVIKSELEDLYYIAMMYGKNGIPADEIENAFQEIQENINYVLKELESDLTVSFSPDKELPKWEDVCFCGFNYPKGFRGSTCPECQTERVKKRKDEIALRIIENGVEKDFEMDSGGGMTIISFAVRIALTMLKRSKTKLNILFLDEVDSALDSHFASNITNSVTKVLTKKLGYSQIIMISHKKEIKNSIPHILKVMRYSTYSKASFVS